MFFPFKNPIPDDMPDADDPPKMWRLYRAYCRIQDAFEILLLGRFFLPGLLVGRFLLHTRGFLLVAITIVSGIFILLATVRIKIYLRDKKSRNEICADFFGWDEEGYLVNVMAGERVKPLVRKKEKRRRFPK